MSSVSSLKQGENPAVYFIVGVHVAMMAYEIYRRSVRNMDDGTFKTKNVVEFSKLKDKNSNNDNGGVAFKASAFFDTGVFHPVIIRRSFITSVYSFGCMALLALSMALVGDINISALGLVGIGFLFHNFFRQLLTRGFAKLNYSGLKLPKALMSEYGGGMYAMRAIGQILLIAAAYFYYQFANGRYGQTASIFGFVILLLGLIMTAIVSCLGTDFLSKGDMYITGELYVAYSRITYFFFIVAFVASACLHSIAMIGDYPKYYALSAFSLVSMPVIGLIAEIGNIGFGRVSYGNGMAFWYNFFLYSLTFVSIYTLASSTCEFVRNADGSCACFGFQLWIQKWSASSFVKMCFYVGPPALTLMLLGFGEIDSAKRPGLGGKMSPEEDGYKKFGADMNPLNLGTTYNTQNGIQNVVRRFDEP